MSVCVQNISERYDRILMIFSTKNPCMLGSKHLVFGEDLYFLDFFVDPGLFQTGTG